MDYIACLWRIKDSGSEAYINSVMVMGGSSILQNLSFLLYVPVFWEYFKTMQCNPCDDVNSPIFSPPLVDMADAVSLEGDNEAQILFFFVTQTFIVTKHNQD